jgi:phospholipid/cholesterol/gamma-HCH transport system ATP-binding protein
MNQQPKISVQDLYKSFNEHKVLSGISFDVMPQESLVVMGGSGTGKSVLIKNIIGLIKPDSGNIKIDDASVINLDAKNHIAMLSKCGFLFQGGALFDSMNIEENVTFFASKLYNLSKTDRRDLAVSKLQSVGLSERVLKLFPSELSGGMLKRASLARTICSNPEIIFFDEPTTGLDPIMANTINDLIIKIREELKATTITITHDMHSARQIATKMLLIKDGKMAWIGTKEEAFTTQNQYVYQFVNGLSS